MLQAKHEAEAAASSAQDVLRQAAAEREYWKSLVIAQQRETPQLETILRERSAQSQELEAQVEVTRSTLDGKAAEEEELRRELNEVNASIAALQARLE